MQTIAAADLGMPAVSNALPPPPSISVSDDINAMIAPHAATLGKTRKERMKKHFKSLLREWFSSYSALYCPEDTGHLVSSYNQAFREALTVDMILISSDLEYAGFVESLEIQVPTKPTTKSHFAREAARDIKADIPLMLDQAFKFASS